MALKRKNESQPIIIDDDEPDVKFSASKMARYDVKIKQEKTEGAVESGQFAKKDAEVIVIDAEVHRNFHSQKEENTAVDCSIVKIVKSTTPSTSESVVVVPVVGSEVNVQSVPALPSKMPDSAEVLLISSDEESEENFLDESFSQNQEGSRRVRDFMFQQEMGNFKALVKSFFQQLCIIHFEMWYHRE